LREKTVVIRNAPEAVKRAVAALESINASERAAAVGTLAQIDEETARDALAAAVEHPVKDVRIHAAFMLMRFGDVRAVPGLVEALRDKSRVSEETIDSARKFLERDPFVKRKAIAEFDGLCDSESTVSRIATWCLVQLGPSSVDALRNELRSQDHRVREVAANVLAHIGDCAIPGLAEDLHDSSPTVRYEAAVILSLARTLARDITLAESRLIQMVEDGSEHLATRVMAEAALRGSSSQEAKAALERLDTDSAAASLLSKSDRELLAGANQWFDRIQRSLTVQQPAMWTRIEFTSDEAETAEEPPGARWTHGPSVKRGVKAGTLDRVKEAHRLATKEGVPISKACDKAHTDTRTYYQYCRQATGEEPVSPP
jgi:HEAT repeat protein